MIPARTPLRWITPVLLVPLAAGADLKFREVAAASGVTFRHDAAKTERKHLVEAMGAGVAIFDFDNDGRLDLYFVNGADQSAVAAGSAESKSDPRYWNRLYRNAGDWSFEDVTEAAGAAGRGYGMGVAVADYDGDGDADLFVSNFGPDLLLRNEGDGSFVDVTEQAGIRGPGWSSGAAFFDYDGDGWLDLFVATYLDWTFETSRPCGEYLPERNSYCHPRLFPAAAHTLYRNLGGGRFEDVSASSGIADHPGKGLGVAVNDYDADGWPDVFVANDSHPQQLFRNLAGSGFEEVAVQVGVAYDAEGREYAGMGVAWEDYDSDGRPDLLVNALGRQGYWLYRNREGAFEAASEGSAIAALSELRSGWGMALADFDNDGWRDLIVGQGHVMDDISDSDEALAHREPLMLAQNHFGRFYDVAARAGPVFRTAFAARGLAVGDLDGDGAVDVAVNVSDGPALLLRNESRSAASLVLRLEGAGGNRDAVGAAVRARCGAAGDEYAFFSGAGSYLSASPTDIRLGLGREGRCEAIQVRWPDGSVQSVSNPPGPTVHMRQRESSGTGGRRAGHDSASGDGQANRTR